LRKLDLLVRSLCQAISTLDSTLYMRRIRTQQQRTHITASHELHLTLVFATAAAMLHYRIHTGV
jgi:hypothetical protein